LKKGL